MDSGGSVSLTRTIVIHTLRELRSTILQERHRQRLRRWTGRPYFLIDQPSTQPTMIDVSGTGIDPLWDTSTTGPADLDVERPIHVKHRETVGQMWIIRHDHDDVQISIVLVVGADQQPWLVPRPGRPYPANKTGWLEMTR